jgi:hypothetical protein
MSFSTDVVALAQSKLVMKGAALAQMLIAMQALAPNTQVENAETDFMFGFTQIIT